MKYSNVKPILNHIRGSPHIAISPLVWQPNPTADRSWYFIVASGKDPNHFSMLQVTAGNDEDFASEIRSTLLISLVGQPIVVHDFDDELEFTRWCTAIWPCDKSRQIHDDLKREREEMAH
jgi:hypothetical protein